MIKRIDLYNGGSCLALQCSCPAEKITDKLLIYSPFKVERKKKKREKERKKENRNKTNKQKVNNNLLVVLMKITFYQPASEG